MGLIRAAAQAVRGTLADQWVDFFTAPVFDEQTLVSPGTRAVRDSRAGVTASANIITDGTRVSVPEGTAVIITDGGAVVSMSCEPGYFTFWNEAQPSLFAGSGVHESLITQSWERFKFGGQPGQEQRIFFVNLREIRNIRFGTPGPLPYRDFSLVPPGSTQAPVLRLKARGRYSIQVEDPIRFFQNFLPANKTSYSLADDGARQHLSQEFVAAFQAALQSLSRSTDIASLAAHGPALSTALTIEGGPGASWLERFGLEVVSVAVAAIEYDEPSRKLMDKYNEGTLLGGGVGNAYAQAKVADAAFAMGSNGAGGDGLIGLALGLGSIGGTLSGMTQPAAAADQGVPPQPDPVVVLTQLKAMLDQGLITAEQFALKQQEILTRM